MRKLFLLLVLVMAFTGTSWAASSTSSTRTDCQYQNGFCDPRVYGGAADTMKQTTTHTAGTDTLELTITAGYVEMASNASSTLVVTMTETGAFENDRTVIVNVGSGAITFSDQSGILDVASTSSLRANDTLSLVYTGTIWVETSRAHNN